MMMIMMMMMMLGPFETYPVPLCCLLCLSRLHEVVCSFSFCRALKYVLTCSTFCPICIGGRSTMNRIVLAGVYLVVPSLSLITLFCTLSKSGSFFVYCFLALSKVKDCLSVILFSGLVQSQRLFVCDIVLGLVCDIVA